MDKSILDIHNVSFSYQEDQKVLEGISTSIRPGEKIAVMGANGAGKSTFFLLLNGVLTPDEGEIFLEGARIGKKNINELRRQVGIVFQDADSQMIASTVFSEISFGPMNLKLPKDEVKTRVEEALKYMNLMNFRNRPPHYLSGGEKKRVSIADIIAMKSEIIIFDEPMAALDPMNADMLQEVLDQISSSGKTLLISTHDVDFAWRFARRVLVFGDGGIICDADPETVFSDADVMETAHLKKPVLLSIFEAMQESDPALLGLSCPKSTEEMTALIRERSTKKYENQPV